jgi:mannose-6-phosphate isomerase-like protein (cupin superfamily)
MEPAVIRREDAALLEKHGVKMHIYTGAAEGAPAGVVYQETESGHAEEFRHDKSAFIYYIIEGEGVYVIGGVEYPVGAGDVVVVPPGNSIYFRGRLRQVLVTVPPWEEAFERHIRDVAV